MTTIAQDTFTRANQSGWGTGSDGKVWSEVAGTDPLSISSNQGVVAKNTGTSDRMLYGSGTISGSQEALVRCTIGSVTQDSGILLCSDSTTANSYIGRFATTANTLEIGKRVSGSFTQLTTASFTFSAGNAYWLRFRVQGGTLYIRAWLDGNSEPGTWTGSVADATFSSGQYGLTCFLGTTSETFDSFSVTDVTVQLSATMAGAGTLTGTTSLSTALSMTVAGIGILTGTTQVSTALTTTLLGIGTLSGTISIMGQAALAAFLPGVGMLFIFGSIIRITASNATFFIRSGYATAVIRSGQATIEVIS